MEKLNDYYGELTFNKSVMREKLSKAVYQKLIECIENNEQLDGRM